MFTIPNKRANYFLNNKKAKVLVNDLIAAGIPAPITTTSSGETGIRGGGSTWMYEDVFFAYCAWIDDEFYSIVAQVFGHAARGDGDAAVDAARSVVRIKGIEVRKKATASWARAGAKGFDYQWATDLGYVVSRGKKASELRKEKGLEPKTNLREHSTDDELNKDIMTNLSSHFKRPLYAAMRKIGFGKTAGKIVGNTVNSDAEHSYTLSVNDITDSQMTEWLGIDESIVKDIVTYREKFHIFHEVNAEDGRVDLEDLWEAVGKPYGRFQAWLDQRVVSLCTRLKTEISVLNHPTGKRGREHLSQTIDIETAKALAMMVNNEQGDIVRRYFLSVEKVLKLVVKHNLLRVNIHQVDLDYKQWLIDNKGDSENKAEGKMIELRGMTLAICGARNLNTTDPSNYQNQHILISGLRKLYKHDKVYEILNIPPEQWWDNHKKSQ